MGTTLTAADTIVGGAGTDTLGVTGAGGAVIPASAAVTGVETVAITTGGGDSIDAHILTGLTSITVTSAANAHTIAVTDATTETFSVTSADADANTDDEIALIDINLASTTGTADEINLTLTNADNDVAFTVTDLDSTNDGVETLNLTLTQGVEIGTDGAADIIIDDFSSAYTTINISGDADATIAENVPTTTATVNASSATGALLIELGAANHTVTGGSGDDTFDFNANLATADTATGGAGDDTLISTIPASRISPTVSGVESGTLAFDNAGTFAMTNVTGMTALTVDGTSPHNILNVDSSLSSVVLREEGADVAVTITYDSGVSTPLTLDFDEVTAGTAETYAAITVSNNAGDFTVDNSDGIWSASSITNATTTGQLKVMTSVDAAADTLTIDGAAGIDAINATSVIFETGGSNIEVSGAATHSFTDATSITVNALDGDVNINHNDTVVVTDADVTVSLTASGGDSSDIDITDLDVDHVTTLTATATNGSDILIDGEIVFLGVDSTTAATDVSTVFTFEADGDGSTVTIDDIAVDGAVTLDSLVLKSSNDGVVSFTATDTTLTITDIDGTALNGDDFVITLGATSLAAATTINLAGSTGDGTVTLSEMGDTLTLGAGDMSVALTNTTTDGGTNATTSHTITAGSGVDTFTPGGADASEITGFTQGTDKIVLDISLLEAVDGTDLATGNSASITALTAVVIDEITTGAGFTLGTGDSVFRLSGTFADTAAVDAELIAQMDDGSVIADDLVVMIWNDGTNAHISAVEITTLDAGNDDTIDAVLVHDMLVLMGVDHTTLTANDFNGAFVA
jgi:hypothetical protein